jgi:preprotein translocase subunit SecF
MYQIIQKRNIWLSLSGIMVGLFILALLIWGFNFGIDFTGGSLLEVEFSGERPIVADVQSAVSDLNLSSLVVQPVGDSGMILRFQETSEEKHQEVLEKLDSLAAGSNEQDDEKIIQQESEKTRKQESKKTIKQENNKTRKQENKDNDNEEQSDEIATGTEVASSEEGEGQEPQITEHKSPVEELRFDSVGPTIGQELKRKSVNAMALVLVAIVLYIAWVFRKVSKPVASWKYGITAIIALFHDVIITIGIFAVLGKFFNVEINAPFVAAILTVIGYSVNDTIVVFDRVRENLPKSEEDFEGTVNISVNQTIKRSINTSFRHLFIHIFSFAITSDLGEVEKKLIL